MNDVAKYFKAPVPVLFLLTLCSITALLSTTKSTARKSFFLKIFTYGTSSVLKIFSTRFVPAIMYHRSHLHTLSKYPNFNLLTYQRCENRNIKILCYCKCVNIYYFHLAYLKYIFEFSMCSYIYRH